MFRVLLKDDEFQDLKSVSYGDAKNQYHALT
jgi:hypothetical protein